MKSLIFTALLLFGSIVVTPACGAAAVDTDSIAGDWTGESICTVHPSPCHDEHVIYHITEPDSAGKFQIKADKIVDGKPEFMGTLDCTYDREQSTVACPMRGGMWNFTVTQSVMNGTLKLPDGTLYRKISVKKKSKD
jgi:hypothetical protein